MSHQHIVTVCSVIQEFLNGNLKALVYLAELNPLSLTREFSHCLMFSVGAHWRAEFPPPKEAYFTISPIKYVEILSSSTRQEGHLCNPAIFNLLVFSDCSVDLKFTCTGRNGIAVSETNTFSHMLKSYSLMI